MLQKHILIVAALSISLSGCHRHPPQRGTTQANDSAAASDTEALDQASVMIQLTGYLSQNWSDINNDQCSRVFVPQSFVVRDKRTASNGDLELQADITFLVTSPGDIPDLLGNSSGFILTHDLGIFESGCVPSRLTQQFGLEGRNLSAAPVGFGQQVTATGTTITLTKWTSGYKVSGFKFQ